MRKGKLLMRTIFMKCIIPVKLLLFSLLSHHIIALILACCILPAARQGFDFTLAILKVLFVI